MALEEALVLLQGHLGILQPGSEGLPTAGVAVQMMAIGLTVSMFGSPMELAGKDEPVPYGRASSSSLSLSCALTWSRPGALSLPGIRCLAAWASNPESLRVHQVVEAARMMGFASAAYGPVLVNEVFFPGTGMPVLDRSNEQANRRAIALHTGVAEVDIVTVDLPDPDNSFRPSYYLVMDRATQHLLLCIRGTLTVPDAITDLLADHVPFAAGGTEGIDDGDIDRGGGGVSGSGSGNSGSSGSVHRGMARFARILLGKTEDEILKVWQTSLRVTV